MKLPALPPPLLPELLGTLPPCPEGGLAPHTVGWREVPACASPPPLLACRLDAERPAQAMVVAAGSSGRCCALPASPGVLEWEESMLDTELGPVLIVLAR